MIESRNYIYIYVILKLSRWIRDAGTLHKWVEMWKWKQVEENVQNQLEIVGLRERWKISHGAVISSATVSLGNKLALNVMNIVTVVEV